MSKEKIEQAPSEYLARSPQGLWVKGIRTDETIELYWKPRFLYEGSMVTVLDFNGDVEIKVHGADIDWGDEWRLAGKIDLVDEMAVMSGLEHFDRFVFGLMRHAVRLLTCGYGDDPSEVISWFSDFGARKFIVEDKYSVIDEHGQFEDLIGCSVIVERVDGDSLVARLEVNGVGFVFDLNDSWLFTSFVIATSPI